MDAHYTTGTAYQGNHRQYPLLPNLQSQFQQPPHPSPHTLPPLQPQRAALAYANDLFAQSARSPPSMLPLQTPQFNDYNAPGRPRYPISMATYPQALLQFSNNAPYISQPAHTLAYDPHQTSANVPGHLPDLRPMPAGGTGQHSVPALSTDFDPTHPFSLSASTQDHGESPRTHVVGSQGRRGILPSAAGRPAAVAKEGNSSAKSAAVPTKDADGKFPCPHCNKTYLHAKHLKRHLLRHTGDRPYSCILCNDTFSRSDILKRHFQKCSIRRGNPTGATHLSNSQSHMKRQGAKKAPNPDGDEPDFSSICQTPISAPQSSFADGNSLGLGIQTVPEVYQPAPQSGSQSGTVQRSDNSPMVRDKRSMTGPIPPAFHRASLNLAPNERDSTSLPSSTVSTPLILRRDRHSAHFSHIPTPDQLTPGLLTHNSDLDSLTSSSGRNSLPQLPSTSHIEGNGYDWTTFPSDVRQGFGNQNLPLLGQANPLGVKVESQESKVTYANSSDHQHEELLNGLFGDSSSTVGPGHDDFQHWHLHQPQMNPFLIKSERLISFCRAANSDVTANDELENEILRYCLSIENIEHFLGQFSHFQGHWPVIHMPTFSPVDAYDGLILSMICIGAVYSDRLHLGQVRILLGRTKRAIEQSSRIFSFIRGSPLDPDFLDRRGSDGFEEIQALVLLQTLSIWHGDAEQRRSAREDFEHYVKLARQLRMLQPTPPHSSNYSLLHQPSPLSEQVSMKNWNWLSWVRQEKRSRLMYTIFLVDAALVIYFNCRPHFNPMDIRSPLPADDAAWEATNAHDCAEALGLHGPNAQDRNTTGSRRQKQPEMHLAMKALLHPHYEFELRSTNAFSKFILIHGLHVQIWNVQRQLSQDNTLLGFNEMSHFGSGSTTPISQYDWVSMGNASARTSKSNSGQATPTDSSGAQSPGPHQMLKSTTMALAKWKRIWDDDMPLQYPPDTKRIGFCRDGIHFYWLAHMFLHKARASDWLNSPDSRFLQVMALLKQARSYVASENVKLGEETGSVGDIDERYGVADLTLDMKLLFTPLAPDFSPSIPGVNSRVDGSLI